VTRFFTITIVCVLAGCSSDTETLSGTDAGADTPAADLCAENPCEGVALVCALTVRCVPETGQCVAATSADTGAACNLDSSLCTVEQCDDSHACVPVQMSACPEPENPCMTATCDAVMGCGEPAPKPGAQCSDDDACTSDDACLAGECVGTPLPVDDGNGCTLDSCVDGNVRHDPGAGVCTPTDPCSTGGVCASGICKPDTPCACQQDEDCPESDNACLGKVVCDTSGGSPVCTFEAGSEVTCPSTGTCETTACEPSSGQCVTTAKDGEACDDDDACTADDQCGGSTCEPGSTVACNDSDPCTSDACDPQSGCVFTPVTAGCAACPADSECLTQPCDVPLVIGEPTVEGGVSDSPAGGSLEIVQGPQGGVHLEVAIGVTAPSSGAFIKASVELATHLGCCDTAPVGNYVNPNLPLYTTSIENYWTSGALPIIFDQDTASSYVGQTCCVTATVTVLSDESKVTHAAHTFACTDFF
jgi:hypothetical protein